MLFEQSKIKIGAGYILAFRIKLSGKNLIVLRGEKGYVMCGYLNLKVAQKFGDAAVKIVGVSTIRQALKSRVHSLTTYAAALGIRKGQPVKKVLARIA